MFLMFVGVLRVGVDLDWSLQLSVPNLTALAITVGRWRDPKYEIICTLWPPPLGGCCGFDMFSFETWLLCCNVTLCQHTENFTPLGSRGLKFNKLTCPEI